MENENIGLGKIEFPSENWLEQARYEYLTEENFFLQEYIDIDNMVNIWNKVRERGLPSGRTYDVSSGTGFYIAPGYILTNQHVVTDCLNISIRGSVDPAAAVLFADDKDIDLALIKTDATPPKIASFRNNDGLSVGSKIFAIGYPLDHGEDGLSSFKDGAITIMNLPIKNSKEIEFTNIIDKGNSGGPLIDTSGNVVGVINAKKHYYHNSKDANSNVNSYKIHGLAIGLSLIDQFLHKYNIGYTSSGSYSFLNNLQIESQAKDYIVNIHCIQNKNT